MVLHLLLRDDFLPLQSHRDRGTGEEGHPPQAKKSTESGPRKGPKLSQTPLPPPPSLPRALCADALPSLCVCCPHTIHVSPPMSCTLHAVRPPAGSCPHACRQAHGSSSTGTADVGSAHLKIALPGSRQNSWALMEFAEKLISADWQWCQALPGPDPS